MKGRREGKGKSSAAAVNQNGRDLKRETDWWTWGRERQKRKENLKQHKEKKNPKRGGVEPQSGARFQKKPRLNKVVEEGGGLNLLYPYLNNQGLSNRVKSKCKIAMGAQWVLHRRKAQVLRHVLKLHRNQRRWEQGEGGPRRPSPCRRSLSKNRQKIEKRVKQPTHRQSN